MTTLDQLVAQVKQNLMGFSLTQESMTRLMADMTAGDGTFQADGETIDNLSAGIAEIDDELVLVQKWDSMSGTVTVLGGTAGRGYAATTAAAHTTGALITSAPAYPRARVKEAINRAIEALYPHLVVFGELNFPYVSAQLEYPVPADAMDIWYVTQRWVGPEKISGAVGNWRFNPKAYATDFPTGKSIQVFDSVTPGQNVRVIYTKRPTALSAGSDVFSDVTGYDDRIADLVVWDATKRLLPSAMGARLQQQAIEATERAVVVSSRDVAAAVQMYATLYAERLADERSRQFTEDPNYAAFMGS
ncbi:hypothetical protein [Streptomyces sp. t39]|uniref:phage adaptor protein n=1 Tax=Streptomyces sp. t39 TaxID=1828156 RepID=UPI0011CDB87C|nr:hypothetical protein [Streptomyces sp. t39]TXS35073.1 hypothetical protein EAO77_37900 [Streptomyces sp. t39]